MSVDSSVCPSDGLSVVYLTVGLSIRRSVRPSVCPSVGLSVRASVCPSVGLSIRRSVRLLLLLWDDQVVSSTGWSTECGGYLFILFSLIRMFLLHMKESKILIIDNNIRMHQ